MSADHDGAPLGVAAELVARAAGAYQAHDWSTALELYRRIRDTLPVIATELGCPVIIGHCEIEAADEAGLDAPVPVIPASDNTLLRMHLVNGIRTRALALCRRGDHRRASNLLRLIAPLDPAIGDCYANGLLTRRSRCDVAPPARSAEPPAFLADQGVADWPVATLRERYRGLRVLFVRRYAYMNNPARQNEFLDRMTRSAMALGFTALEFNAAALPGPQSEAYPAALQQVILQFKPDLILYDELFMSGVSAEPGLGDQIGLVLENARRHLGVRVVKSYPDVWCVTAFTPDALFKHLGRCYDMVHHLHPAILDRGTAAEKAAVFCYPYPMFVPLPATGAGSVARACFVGSVTHINIARLVWWAECQRAGLPLDFIGTDPHDPEKISDAEYGSLLHRHQLVVNFTMRPTGVRIHTGRAIEAPLAGSVLIEEDNPDTRYFMTPGVHYIPFETLPDLADLIPALLADAPRRRELAAAGQAWARRYFTGDHFWAGMLSRLYGC